MSKSIVIPKNSIKNKTVMKGKFNKGFGIFSNIFVPLSFVVYIWFYCSIMYSSVVMLFNKLVGYISFDTANIHTYSDTIYYENFFSMLTVIPANEIIIFIPTLAVLGVVATLYLVSLFLKEDRKQKAVIFGLSIFIMLAINTFFLFFVVGINDGVTIVIAISSLIDLFILSDKVKKAFFVNGLPSAKRR